MRFLIIFSIYDAKMAFAGVFLHWKSSRNIHGNLKNPTLLNILYTLKYSSLLSSILTVIL